MDEHDAPPNDHETPKIFGLAVSVQEFAAPAAQLTNQAEMVLSLINLLVQVYTLPRTGQLAYIGHACNFRHKVASFFTSLQLIRRDMPFVMVRPRTLRHQASNKMLFKVDVEKLRAAFLRLEAHNPYHRHINWDDAAKRVWSEEDVIIGRTREEEFLNGQSLPVMQELKVQQNVARDCGFSMGQRLLEILLSRTDLLS